jgi:hypothetical protein
MAAGPRNALAARVLVAFPTLVALGVPALTSNATSTPGSASTPRET